MGRSARFLIGTVVASPTIKSFSPDTNIIGDGITDANVLTIGGTAVENSTVNIYDGSKLLGTALADSTGLWTFKTGALIDGVHNFTATDTVAGSTSAASSVQSITVDTIAPASPVILSESVTGINQVLFSGTAEANSKITVYDGAVQLGTTMADATGAWNFTSGTLPTGLQTFTATATDAAGNTSLASQPVSQTIISQFTVAGGIAAPAQATLQGYTQLAFDDEFNSINTIDMSNSHNAGYDWYLQNWFSSGSTDPKNVTISDGVLELGGGTGNAALVSAFADSSGGYTGSVFGNGAYIEARIKFDPSGGSGATSWPAFWGLSIEHITGTGEQWSGQTAGYAHFAEVDFMEYMSGVGLGSTQYLGTIHDWSGTYTTSNGWQFNIQNNENNFINVGSIDWSTFHTYGLMWVPQSGTTPGHATWYFDGQAMTTIYWLGPATSPSLQGISGGSFTPSSPDQATTTYSILDNQQLALSLQTDSTWPMYVDWVRVWQTGSAATSSAQIAVDTPIIASISTGSSVLGNGITNANILTLSGTAEANSVELIYDGTNWIGSATADAKGAWTFTTGTLENGVHNFTATSTDSTGSTSLASLALTVTVDTVAPVLTQRLAQDTGSSSTDRVTSNATLTGTGDPNAVVHFTVDGKAIATTVTADANGAWTFTPTGLTDGAHTITASETDAAGNTGSLPLSFTLDSTAPTVAISSETLKNNKVTLTGTASEAGDTISIYDGATLLGTTKSGTGGTWSFSTTNLSNAVHTFTVTATDTAGNVGRGSNSAILGGTGANTLTGSSGNDIIVGNGGNDVFVGGAGADVMTASSGNNTFVFKAVTDSTPTAFDTIAKFDAFHDTILLTGIPGINASNGVPSFQGLLTGSDNFSLQPHGIGFLEIGGNTFVFVNTSNAIETVTAQDMHAADMLIVLTGTHLGLTSSDFHIV